jgi:hypothetical protein
MILKIFSPKKIAQNWRFWLKTQLNYFEEIIITLDFWFENICTIWQPCVAIV